MGTYVERDYRSKNLWHHYRMTVEEYDALREAQGYRCAICDEHEDDIDTSKVGGRPHSLGRESIKFALHVDHSHDGDAVRGLLCNDCNIALGRFRDDPDLLRSAIAYLDRVPGSPIDRSRTRPRRRPNTD